MNLKNTKITDILSLLVFTLLALCMLAVLLCAAGIYQDTVEQGRQSHERSVALHYISTRLHQADGQHVSVEDFQGCRALSIREEINGKSYLTRVYCYEGWLCELYAAEKAKLGPESGEKLVPAEGLDFTLEDGLLSVSLSQHGRERQTLLYLRSGEEGMA